MAAASQNLPAQSCAAPDIADGGMHMGDHVVMNCSQCHEVRRQATKAGRAAGLLSKMAVQSVECLGGR